MSNENEERDTTPWMKDRMGKNAVQMAIGRIFKICSRPTQDGDVREYFKLRDFIMENSPHFADDSPNWVKDRNKGAQGD